MRKNHAKLIKKLNNNLEKEEFILRHKTCESAFTRNRFFSFKSITLFILSSIQSSLQRELDRFFSNYNNSRITERFVSKSAFSQARKKISPEAFRELNTQAVDFFYSYYDYSKWKGHRLIAIDGSEVLLPHNEETIAKYGDYSHTRSEKSVVLARFSKYYDVLNRISVDALLTPRKLGEQLLAEEHLKYSSKDDLVLMDRGYPSLYLFRTFLDKGVDFCCRLTIKNWKIAQNIVETKDDDILIPIEVPKHLKKEFYKKRVDTSTMKLRVIKLRLKTGEYEVLITSLVDKKIYPHGCFKNLYKLRWGVEESYKVDKHQIRIEDFSGYTVASILQEFNAMILLSNLASVFSFLPKLNQKQGKHRYKVNITIAISKMKDNLVTLFRNLGEIILIAKLINSIWLNVVPIRDNRSFPRNVYRRRRYHNQYKNL